MISIICPVYNCSSYLKTLVDSIIVQSYKDWELILIDDGSTDSSGLLCDEYSSIDKRVRVIHQENGGVSSARNTGIKAASGSFLYFADSDDELFPDCLSVLVGNMQQNVDLVTGSYERYVDGVLRPEKVSRDNFVLSPKDYFDVITTLPNAHFCERYLWTKLFRASLVKERSILFDESLFYGEDVHFLFNYVVSCNENNTIVGINHLVYKYYRRSDGAASQNTKILTPHSFDMFLGAEKRFNLIKNVASPTAIGNQKRELIATYKLFKSLLQKDSNNHRRHLSIELNHRLANALTNKEYIIVRVKEKLGPYYFKIKRLFLFR